MATKTKNEVATVEPAGLPALPALPDMYERVDPTTDVQVPSIYLQQGLSNLVQDGVTKIGDVIVGLGADDPDPSWLIGGENDLDSFTAYILTRRISYARFEGNDMTWLDRIEYEAARAARDRDVWKTFHYVLAIPAYSSAVPARLMLTKTAGRKPSQRINHFIDKAIANGETDPVCVTFTVGEEIGRQSKQKYTVLQPTLGTPSPEGLEIARSMMARAATLRSEENEGPADHGQPDI
jgi:hypothetical protein